MIYDYKKNQIHYELNELKILCNAYNDGKDYKKDITRAVVGTEVVSETSKVYLPDGLNVADLITIATAIHRVLLTQKYPQGYMNIKRG